MLGIGISTNSPLTPDNALPWWEMLYPGATLVADFRNNRAMKEGASVPLSDFLGISRSTEGYAENMDGSLTQFGANQFRLSDRGILIEASSNNLVTYSQDLTTADWTVLGSAAIVSNSDVAPDGTQTAQKIQNLGAVNDGVKFLDPASTSIASNSYTFSVYLKSDSPEQIELIVGANSGSTSTSNLTANLTTQWQRFTVPHTFASDNADFTLQLIRPAGSAIQSFHAWGVQFEPGTYESSYIKTTGSAAQRAADAVPFTDLSWLDTAKGTILMNVQSDQGTISNRRLLGFASAQGVETSPSATDSENWNGGSLLIASSGSGDGWTEGVSIGLAWDSSGRTLVMAGGSAAEDIGIPGNLSIWHLGSRDGTSSFWQGYIKELAYFNYKKTNTALIAETT